MVSYAKTGVDTYAIFYAGKGKLCHTILPGKLLVTDTAMHRKALISLPLPKSKLADIQSVRSDAYHRLWVTTIDNGLLCYNEVTGKSMIYLHNNSVQKSLPINILSDTYIDRSDNLWIGTDGGGVSKADLKPPKFNLFPLNEGDYTFLKDYFVKCFYEDQQGRIWFGTYSSGLNRFDPVTGELKNYNHPGKRTGLPGSIISSIFKDKQGLLWVAYSTGVAIYNEKNDSFKPVKLNGIPSLNKKNYFIYKIIQLQNGELLAATRVGFMTIRKKERIYTGFFGDIKPEAHLVLTDVVEMADHTLWATSPVRGLSHYSKQGNDFKLIERKFPSIDLRSIHQDEINSRILWIGTGIGLLRFNTLTGDCTRYDERNGMASSYVYGILEDDQQNIWLSNNKGICFFNRKTQVFKNYTVKDGLQSNEFNTQAFYKSATGTLYFGGVRGFNWFKPQAAKIVRVTIPGVAITDIDIDNQPYIKDASFFKAKTIILPHDRNNISFRFAALDYTRPAANRIQFILQGWEKNWSTSTDEMVRYAHLEPESYLLRVKAANGDDSWSKEESLIIVIKTPFWQTPWFYISAGISLLGIVIYSTYLLSQQKIKKHLRELEKQQAINAERNRISRDMHDEIGSGLTHIALLSELINTQKKTGIAIKNDVGNIALAARKLVESMSEIIWALNPQNYLAENLLAYTREQMQNYYAPFDLKLIIDFPDQAPNIKLSNEQRRNLYLVTKEGLNNVLKHAKATSVTLRVGFSGSCMQFEISDNGTGLDNKKVKTTGNGLKNMRKRMDDISGNIEWISSSRGLCVRYSLNAQYI
jgi:signal transduction histidine kinase/streptogramin lyase